MVINHHFRHRLQTMAVSMVTAAALLFLSLSSHANTPLTFSATYNANIKGFAVKATRELKTLENNQYELSFRATSWAAKIDEISTFTVKDQLIQPLKYHYTQSALGKKRERALVFDRKNQQVISTEKDESKTIPNQENLALDKLNYQLQLQLDLIRQSNQPPNNQLDYQIANKGVIKGYRFEVAGEEVLETALGALNTVKVHIIRDNPRKTTHIWFAKDWSYLLVQLKQFKDNKQKLSININTATVNGTTVTDVLSSQ